MREIMRVVKAAFCLRVAETIAASETFVSADSMLR